MTVSDPPTPKPLDYDPDSYRMTIGEHLEELRGRMIRALVGLLIVGAICLWFGKETMSVFCAPLVHTLQKYDLSPQLHSEEVADIFMSYIQISLISAAALSAPWMVYQLWQFVAAGLYPHERKYITRYIPLSLGLLIAGMLFVYFLVLPWTLEFFIAFSTDVPLPAQKSPVVQLAPTSRPSSVMMIAGDPANPTLGEMWFDTTQKRLKFFLTSPSAPSGEIKIIPFSAQNLIATEYNLPEYIDLVVGMLLTFGLSFQMPLVVMALARIGIVEIDMLRSFRKYVYFAMSIIAAAITPGDVITATVALMVPLCLLYELGIWLAVMGERRAAKSE